MHGRQKFLFSVKRENNEYFCFMHKVNDFWWGGWENNNWHQLTDGTLCRLVEAVSGSGNGFSSHNFGEVVEFFYKSTSSDTMYNFFYRSASSNTM